MKRYLLTSALPYANGYIHLGHIAGAYLPADIYARYLRLRGESVLYVCGSDEHGVAITIKAEQEGITPQENIDRYHNDNVNAFTRFAMSFDVYGRTSSPEHHDVAQEWFTDFHNKNILVEKAENQFYDNDAQMFLPDRYVEGICPNCQYDKARGDQCDNCGAYYNQLDLKNPISLVSKKTPIVKKTTHWYYPLGAFQEQLEQYIDSHENHWKDNVVQQSRSWLKQGLGDRAITRDLQWGVRVPLDNAEGKVLYVWFDAVLGYISATKAWAKAQGTPDAWKEWWLTTGDKSSDTQYYAFIGKDNIVFHTLMFPAMLMARQGYILPENVPANEFLNLEGQKFSKSRNWSIDLRDALNDFPHHCDSLRYALAMNFPETRDSDFTWKDFQNRNNNELAAILGNYVNRTAQFLAKNFNNAVPILPERYAKLDEAWKLLVEDIERNTSDDISQIVEQCLATHRRYFTDHDITVIAAVCVGINEIDNYYKKFRFRDALTATMNIARAANKYFNDTAPWKSLKSDADACTKTMYICSQLLYSLSFVFAPIIPSTSEQILQQLGITNGASGKAQQGKSQPNIFATLALPHLPQGRPLGEPTILFTKIEDAAIEQQIAKLGDKSTTQLTDQKLPAITASSDAPSDAPLLKVDGATETITIDDFMNVKLRTAKVLAAEIVPKSDKLLRLTVETEGGERTIFAGIAKHYMPAELIGKMVVVVWNLAPRKMMGSVSQGMVLAVNAPDGTLSLITPDKPMPSGGEVR